MTTYYVSTTGVDGAGIDGGIDAPWRTVTYGQSRLSAGDTLYIRAGRYYEMVTISVSGTQDNPITIKAYPGETVILDGTIPITGWEQCTAEDSYLTVNSVINPNYANIYRSRVAASVLPTDKYKIKLFEDGLNCRNAIWPDQSLNYGLKPQEFQSLNPNGESFGYKDRLIDTDNLTQTDNYWIGARVAVHLAEYNFNTAYSTAVGFSNGIISLSPDLPALISGSGTRDADVYAIINHPHVLNKAGEFYWVLDAEDSNYYWLYLWPSNVDNLTSKITLPAKSLAFWMVSKFHIRLEDFHILGYTSNGIGSTGSNISGVFTYSNGLTVKNCVISDCGGKGVGFDYTNNSLVEGCTVARVEDRGIMTITGENVTIKDCDVRDTTSTNISFYYVTNGRLIRNTVHGILGGHGNGMSVYNDCKNILVAYNKFPGANFANHSTENIILFANIWDGYDAEGSLVAKWTTTYSKGYYVYAHNTIVSAAYDKALILPILLSTQPEEDVLSKYVFNNVIDGLMLWDETLYPTMVDRTYNFYTGYLNPQGGSNWALGTGEVDGRSYSMNELFINPGESGNDYHLESGSVLIGAGKSLSTYLADENSPFNDLNATFLSVFGEEFDYTKDIAGNTWATTPSIGAYEYSFQAGVITVGSTTKVTNGTTTWTVVLNAANAYGGTAPYTYQWQSSEDGITYADIEGETAQQLTATGLLSDTTYYYRMVVTDDASDTAISYYSGTTPADDDPTPNYQLTVNISGNGTVTRSVEANEDGTYESGTNVVLTAVDDDLSLFSAWSGDSTETTKQITITMSEAKSVTATFVAAERVGVVLPCASRSLFINMKRLVE